MKNFILNFFAEQINFLSLYLESKFTLGVAPSPTSFGYVRTQLSAIGDMAHNDIPSGAVTNDGVMDISVVMDSSLVIGPVAGKVFLKAPSAMTAGSLTVKKYDSNDNAMNSQVIGFADFNLAPGNAVEIFNYGRKGMTNGGVYFKAVVTIPFVPEVGP